ncbi:MAG: ABC transporter ATP-binding protein, partial [Microbacterium gubbeenense]
MSMGRPMGGGRGMRPIDESAQRKANAAAPRVPDLGKRIVALFRPYRRRVAMTALLVVVGAGLGVIPPLVIQRVFDEALFPPSGEVDLSLLGLLVGLMIV